MLREYTKSKIEKEKKSFKIAILKSLVRPQIPELSFLFYLLLNKTHNVMVD